MADEARDGQQPARADTLTLCRTCGCVIYMPRAGKSYCSGACRAKASRVARTDRLTRDLQELQRRLDRIIEEL